MDIKFTPATEEDVENIYFGAKCVYEMFDPESAHDEKLMRTVYDDIIRHLVDCCAVKYRGVKVAYYCAATDDDCINVRYLYVESLFRGKGIGTAILRRCLSDTELPLKAQIHFANYHALSLFRHHGFADSGERTGRLHTYINRNESNGILNYDDVFVHRSEH